MPYDETLNQILKSFELDEYPEEMQEMFLLQFGGLLFKAIMLRGVEEMPLENMDAFDELISDNPEPQDVFTFFEDYLPDFEKLLSEVVTSLKNRSEAITHEFLEEVKEEA